MIIKENTFKMCKGTKRNAILRKAKEPKGEKGHYQAKPRPNKVENKTKSRSNQIQLAQNFHRAILED